MQINILGYGLMGKQISALLCLGGFNINIWNHSMVNEADLARHIKLLKRSITNNIQEGKITFYKNIEDLPDATTIESVVEDLSIKQKLYKIFEKNKHSYFTNSSSFSPEEIGKNVNSIHFFNPINLKLIELFFHNENQKLEVYPILSYLEKLDFEIVEVNSNRGYIGNYILFHEISSALKLIEKFEYSYKDVNLVYRKLYGGRNIFSIIDVVGIDVVYKILKNLKEIDETIYLPYSLHNALQAGAYGKKNKTSIINFI